MLSLAPAALTGANASVAQGTLVLGEVHQLRARTRLTLFRTRGMPNFFARISPISNGGTAVAQLIKYVNCVRVRVPEAMSALPLSLRLLVLCVVQVSTNPTWALQPAQRAPPTRSRQPAASSTPRAPVILDTLAPTAGIARRARRARSRRCRGVVRVENAPLTRPLTQAILLVCAIVDTRAQLCAQRAPQERTKLRPPGAQSVKLANTTLHSHLPEATLS